MDFDDICRLEAEGKIRLQRTADFRIDQCAPVSERVLADRDTMLKRHTKRIRKELRCLLQ